MIPSLFILMSVVLAPPQATPFYTAPDAAELDSGGRGLVWTRRGPSTAWIGGALSLD